MKRISVIIVNYRTPTLAIAAIESLSEARSSFSDLQVIVVDGASGDGSAQLLEETIVARQWQDWVELLPLSINGGFAFANNRAMKLIAARGRLPDYIALINPDARARPGALVALAAVLNQHADAGAVGAQLIHEDGRLQASAFHFPTFVSEFCRGARTSVIDRLLRHRPLQVDPVHAAPVPWVTGAAVMFRTTALQSVGLFDEGFFLYYEETELMWRLARSGWQIWHEPAALVVHDGGVSTQIRDPETGNPLTRRIPGYWYQSRRRYFTLVGGRIYATWVSLAWLLGHSIWSLRRALTGRPDDGPISPVADLLTYGFWQSNAVARSAILRFDESASPKPAWMTAGRDDV